MFVDHIRRDVWNKIRRSDFRLFEPWLTPQVFEKAATKAGVPLGDGPLNRVNLVWLGLMAALNTTKSFAAVLMLALKLLRNAPNWDPLRFTGPPKRSRPLPAKDGCRAASHRRHARHDPHGDGDPFRISPEAFTQARKAMPWSFWVALALILVEQFEAAHPQAVRFRRFRLLALDGSALELDQWSDLVARAGTASNGKSRRPRARLVLVQLPLARLPLRFDLVPWGIGEKTVARRVLDVVGADDLILIDRGFWSYGLFWQVKRQRGEFAIREVRTATLRVIKGLGPGDQVVSYAPTDRKWRRERLPEAMELRRIAYQIKGFRPSAVVTSVLDPEQIGRDEFVRLATVDQAGRVLEPGLYHRRWEIETTFNELKHSQNMDGNFRSRTAEGIGFEVASHLMLYLLVRLRIAEAALGVGQSPLRLSYKQGLEDMRDMRESLLRSSDRHARRVLLPRLIEQVASHLVPLRPGRHYPRPHDKKARRNGQGRAMLPSKLEDVNHLEEVPCAKLTE
jgi:hypothetical protein